MQVALCRVTARRYKTRLVTTGRQIIGFTADDPDAYLDQMARILAHGLYIQLNKKEQKLAVQKDVKNKLR
ncbi:hypothetical protein [Desulforamulus ferrireducens]|uniref:Uncharacterized protein n=1 Tax=Desulforamulus ferrireducens TaxID=1833852 RepID=A0A1S6IZT8_9FIRM|nr:hypothetical protein [Desulforamulus ferrireducens]AQS60274.1 hypothetical protein B0537_15060 [Desulforamulus ferrireducens]